MSKIRDYLNEGFDHGIAPLHISKETFRGVDPTTLVGKPFRAGHRSFRIAAVEVTEKSVVITLGRETTGQV